MKFLEGKKSFIVAGLFVLFAAALILKIYIPGEIYAILAALGLAAGRDALGHISGNQGWKTYTAAAATLIISIASMAGLALPVEAIYSILTALGIVGVRHAVNKVLNPDA